jgi:RNA polymerase sigma factor (sigma-70 family)
MATSTLNPLIDRLRRAVLLRDGAALTDGQLLECFVNRKDEAALGALVRRHGPMVLGVCRRVLRNHHDAEDSFQATFLVLVRKARSIVPREMVANWLYGVAYRTALKARSMLARQRMRERQVQVMPEPGTDESDNYWHDLQPLLDQELSRLPDKFRVPILLCDLEGKAGKDVARQLGCPEGTIASRLSRGRVMLAKRLTRHGVALSGGALAALVSQNAASAGVPISLTHSTVKAASLLAAGQSLATSLVSAHVRALTQGVLKAMLMNKLKMCVLILAGVGVAGTGWGNYRIWADDQPAAQGGRQVTEAEVKLPRTVQPEQDKVKQDDRDLYMDVFLKAFQVSSELAKAKGKKASDDNNKVNQILDLIGQRQDAFSSSNGMGGGRADKDARSLYAEAFLRAFEFSNELAKAKGKTDTKSRPADGMILDSIESAFLQAYDRAKILKQALEEQNASVGKQREEALEALDAFLKAGKQLEQAVKLNAKAQAVQQAKQQIEKAVTRVEKNTHDRRAELEALEEIERLIRQMKKKIQDSRDNK